MEDRKEFDESIVEEKVEETGEEIKEDTSPVQETEEIGSFRGRCGREEISRNR